MPSERNWRTRLPWIDGCAALSAGTVLLLLRRPAADFYDLPLALVTFIGGVNLAYSLIGLSLGIRRARSAAHLTALIGANLLWTAVCLLLAVRFLASASVFGLAHLLGEGAFVGALAVLEWRNRRVILGRSQ